jgi:hypothetical protein
MDETTIETINEIKDQTEQLLRTSTIDDPVETRELLQNIEANLPISVRLNAHGINSLREQGRYIENSDDVLQVDSVLYMGDMGGILCAIECQLDADSGKELLMTSITHLKIDPSHPLAEQIKRYQKNRMASMAIADIGKRRSKFKPQKKKRGFGS